MKQCARSLSATAVPPIVTIRVNGEDELAAGQEEGKKQISEGWDVTRVCVCFLKYLKFLFTFVHSAACRICSSPWKTGCRLVLLMFFFLSAILYT